MDYTFRKATEQDVSSILVNQIMIDTEVCPICLRPYGVTNKKVRYHLSYNPPKFIYACQSCNFAEYLSRHWRKHLTRWQWYKINVVRKFTGKKYDHELVS